MLIRKFGLSAVAVATLVGCSTYRLDAGDVKPSQAASAQEGERKYQPWLKNASAAQLYVQIVTSIQGDDQKNLLDFCGGRGPSLSSEQRDYILTASIGNQEVPLYGFSRSDAAGSCSLNTSVVFLGPLSQQSGQMVVNGKVSSSASSQLHLDSIAKLLTTAMAPFQTLGSSAVVGTIGQFLQTPAIAQINSYISDSSVQKITVSQPLLNINSSGVLGDNGTLVYTTPLTLHETTWTGREIPNVAAGSLVQTIKTRLSLFTAATRDINNSLDLGTTVGPDYNGLTVWTQSVQPLDGSPSKPFRDLVSGLPGGASAVTAVAGISADTPVGQVASTCRTLLVVLSQMGLTQTDQVAVLIDALRQSPAYVVSPQPTNLLAVNNRCFNFISAATLKSLITATRMLPDDDTNWLLGTPVSASRTSSLGAPGPNAQLSSPATRAAEKDYPGKSTL